METHRHDRRHGVDVKERQEGDGDVLVVLAGDLEVIEARGAHLSHVGHEVVVCQAHTLGRTRGAGRVGKGTNLVVRITRSGGGDTFFETTNTYPLHGS